MSEHRHHGSWAVWLNDTEGMNPYIVVVQGCDDSTYAVVDMTNTQAAWFDHICDVINAQSEGGCQPRLTFTPESEASTYDRERAEGPS